MPDTADNLYAFFLGRVRDRLHVILCFSPVGAKFARRAQQFPGLISGCARLPFEFIYFVSYRNIDPSSTLNPKPTTALPAKSTTIKASFITLNFNHKPKHPTP